LGLVITEKENKPANGTYQLEVAKVRIHTEESKPAKELTAWRVQKNSG
jgi:hypothetical protein